MPKAFGTPGPRAIYPDVATSRSLAGCSIEAQLLFDRLLALADDQGRLEGDSVVIKAICVPLVAAMTPRRVEAALAELAAARLILRYALPLYPALVQLVTWWRWQAGQRRAYPSKWPTPPGWDDAVYGHGAGGPKTYREAAGIDAYARELPFSDQQPADLNSAGIPPSRARRAQPLPVPSAGAGAVPRESRSTSAVHRARVEAPSAPQDDSGGPLDRAELEGSAAAAWEPFGDPPWPPFASAWRARGFRLPPTEAQAAMLLEVADARPADLGRWVAGARAGLSASDVVAVVLEHWHALAADLAAAEEAWAATKAADRASAPAALARLEGGR